MEHMVILKLQLKYKWNTTLKKGIYSEFLNMGSIVKVFFYWNEKQIPLWAPQP